MAIRQCILEIVLKPMNTSKPICPSVPPFLLKKTLYYLPRLLVAVTSQAYCLMMGIIMNIVSPCVTL